MRGKSQIACSLKKHNECLLDMENGQQLREKAIFQGAIRKINLYISQKYKNDL